MNNSLSRILAAPIQMEGDETTTSSAFSLTGSLTAAQLEILECLHQNQDGKVEYVPLLTFTDVGMPGNPILSKPCFKLSLSHIDQSVRTGAAVKKSSTKTDLT